MFSMITVLLILFLFIPCRHIIITMRTVVWLGGQYHHSMCFDRHHFLIITKRYAIHNYQSHQDFSSPFDIEHHVSIHHNMINLSSTFCPFIIICHHILECQTPRNNQWFPLSQPQCYVGILGVLSLTIRFQPWLCVAGSGVPVYTVILWCVPPVVFVVWCYPFKTTPLPLPFFWWLNHHVSTSLMVKSSHRVTSRSQVKSACGALFAWLNMVKPSVAPCGAASISTNPLTLRPGLVNVFGHTGGTLFCQRTMGKSEILGECREWASLNV